MNRRKIIAETYKKFVTSFYDYVKEMRDCEQGGHFLNPSPYHLEGDVWAHTLCCYTHVNAAFNKCDLKTEYELKMLCLAVLFHDIGKPTSVIEKDDDKRSFNGHDTRSMQIIMDHHELICRHFEITQDDIVTLMLVIQVHTLYYQLKHPKDIFKYLNYDYKTFRIYCGLSVADANGQIRDDFGDEDNDNKFDITTLLGDNTLPVPQKSNYDTGRYLMIFNGCPASGKDYLAKQCQQLEKVFSWDDIMVELYLQANPSDYGFVYDTIYRNAFNWMKTSKINMLQEVKSRVAETFDSGIKYIGISTAKQTRKSRRCLLGIARENKAVPSIVYVMNHLPTLIERDANRTKNCEDRGKTVGELVISRMYFNQVLPTKKEGFETIQYIFN